MPEVIQFWVAQRLIHYFTRFLEVLLIGFLFAFCGFFLPIPWVKDVKGLLYSDADNTPVSIAITFDAMNMSGRGCSVEFFYCSI